MLFAKSGQIGTLNKNTFARNLFCKWLCNKNLSNTHTFIGPLLSLWEEYISLFRKAPKLAQKMLISLWIKLVKYRWWCWQHKNTWKSSKHSKMSPLFGSGAILTILANGKFRKIINSKCPHNSENENYKHHSNYLMAVCELYFFIWAARPNEQWQRLWFGQHVACLKQLLSQDFFRALDSS